MKKIVAIVDDEDDIRLLLKTHLLKYSYIPKDFSDGAGILNYLFKQKRHVDLILLDLMLPDIDGIEIRKKLKADNMTSSIPIIMLTARAEEYDKVVGLEIGADDYVVKPFSSRELIARIKAVLRRYGSNENEENNNIIHINNINIDKAQYEAFINGKSLGLTKTEFEILKLLASNTGKVFSRDYILDYLWGNDKYVTDRTIDTHIASIRKKLGNEGKIIKNIRGVGYKIEV